MTKSFSRALTWMAVVLLVGAARAADWKAPATKTAVPEPNVVSGTVVAADGSPVVGAKVIIYGSGTRWSLSDAKGHFRIERVSADPYPRHIFAYRDNLVAPKSEVPESVGPNPGEKTYTPMHLTMVEGKRAKFSLVSIKSGKPVVGAMIRFQYPDFRRLTTDKDGVALAAGLFAENYGVDIYGEGFERTQAEVDLSSTGPAGSCKVELNPGGIIRGVVVDDAGKPIAGVNILFSDETAADNWSPDTRRTEKDGKFQERFVSLGRQLDISFSHDQFEQRSFSGDDAILLTSQKPARYLRVVLKHGRISGAVAGTVTDRFGRPIAEANVMCMSNRRVFRNGYGQRNSSNATDAKGRFRFDDLGSDDNQAPDHITVAVYASGYESKTVELKVGSDDHPSETTISLDPGHTVLGQIVDDRGKPVEGAQIFAYGGESAISCDDGIFTLDSLSDKARAQISTPYGETLENVELQIDTTHAVSYTVASPGAILGRVVDAETGKPVQKFHVRLEDSSEAPPIPGRRVRGLRGQINVGKWWTPGRDVNAADGRFKIESIGTASPVEIVIDAAGYERDVNPRAFALPIGQSTESKIELLPIHPADYSSLAVRLLDYRGKPIPNAQLRLVVSTREISARDRLSLRRRVAINNNVEQLSQLSYVDQFVPGTSDADGHHEFTGIIPGRIVQIAYWGDGVPQDIWTSGSRIGRGKKLDITINVPQPAGIHITIDRKAIPDIYYVQIRSVPFDGGQAAQQLTPNQSSFDYPDLAPGEYQITVYSLQKRTQNGQTFYNLNPTAVEQVSIKPGEKKELHFPTRNP